ncbi:peptidase inhibitor family I36 protein [Actinomadura adrarensis]|uniref:Peptidase inhibitor family I36 protein n=1 Tax=Actinomadura adrarensis TaxID=1819600 RepID=A0ABW3CQI0_9ACTN
MWQTLSRVLLSATTIGAVALLPTLPASATTADLRDCPQQALCGWSGSLFTGTMTKFQPGGGCQNSPILLRSAANQHTFPLAVMNVYSGPNCTGAILAHLGPGDSVRVLDRPGISIGATI